MFTPRRLLVVATAVALLSGCASPNPYDGSQGQANNEPSGMSKTAKYGGLGALAGALAGAAIDHNNRGKGALIGAVVAGAGAAGYGYYADQQEKKLRESMANTGVEVQRQGDQIKLIMPGNITFATNSDAISSSFYQPLNNLANSLKQFNQNTIQIVGYTDSDYDVRFVYVEKPDWFMQVDAPRDVIERPLDDELDVSGWELRKTLGLLRKSNPTLLEWLDSPLVYRQETEATAQLRALAEAFYSPPAARNHYLSMARKNFRGYLQGETVRFKKYFYVLRPLLAVRWIDLGLGRPPMTFADLLSTVNDAALLDEVATLLALKRNAGEAAYGPRRPALHAFIVAELEREVPVLPRTREDSQRLDRYLRDTVKHFA